MVADCWNRTVQNRLRNGREQLLSYSAYRTPLSKISALHRFCVYFTWIDNKCTISQNMKSTEVRGSGFGEPLSQSITCSPISEVRYFGQCLVAPTWGYAHVQAPIHLALRLEPLHFEKTTGFNQGSNCIQLRAGISWISE